MVTRASSVLQTEFCLKICQGNNERYIVVFINHLALQFVFTKFIIYNNEYA